jgi:hypothetical protein
VLEPERAAAGAAEDVGRLEHAVPAWRWASRRSRRVLDRLRERAMSISELAAAEATSRVFVAEELHALKPWLVKLPDGKYRLERRARQLAQTGGGGVEQLDDVERVLDVLQVPAGHERAHQSSAPRRCSIRPIVESSSAMVHGSSASCRTSTVVRSSSRSAGCECSVGAPV